MSYDAVFDIDYSQLAKQAGVTRPELSLRITDRLGAKEPEPKLWVTGTGSFIKIRNLLTRCADTSIIPGTLHYNNNPLLSILVDVRKNGDPKLTIAKAGKDLRFRGNISPDGELTQIDWNEKSRNSVSVKSNGLAVRDEVEIEVPDGFTIQQGFYLFQQESLSNGNRSISEGLEYNSLFPKAGYLTARTTYELAQRVSLHENDRTYNFMIIYEVCEDMTAFLDSRLNQTYSHEICEFEVEAKKIIGKIPPRLLKSNDALQDVVTRNLMLIRDIAFVATNKSIHNEQSKAEIALSHLEQLYTGGVDLAGLSLADIFQNAKYKGVGRKYSAEEFSILMGRSIEKTLNSQNPFWDHEQAPLINAAGIAGYLSGLRIGYQIESAEQTFMIEPEKIKNSGVQATLRQMHKSEQRHSHSLAA